MKQTRISIFTLLLPWGTAAHASEEHERGLDTQAGRLAGQKQQSDSLPSCVLFSVLGGEGRMSRETNNNLNKPNRKTFAFLVDRRDTDTPKNKKQTKER